MVEGDDIRNCADDFMVAVVSDTHLGSEYADLKSLHKFYDAADEAGCECVLHCGDLVDGVKSPGNNNFKMFAGPEQLLNYTVSEYPSHLPTYFVGGNHEARLNNEFGMDFGRDLHKARPDLHYLGMQEGAVELNRQVFFLYHGDGSIRLDEHMFFAYNLAKSRCIRNLKSVLCGHLHRYKHIREEGTLVANVPSFQFNPPYMKQKSYIGGMILYTGEDRYTDVEYIIYNESRTRY
jgi:predicted phosphodiesterase